MARLCYNNSAGTLGASLTSGDTDITFATAPPFDTLTGVDYIPLIIDPPTGSPNANFEVVWLTAYTAADTTGTIARGQENTSAAAHSDGVAWVQGPTVADGSIDISVEGVTYSNWPDTAEEGDAVYYSQYPSNGQPRFRADHPLAFWVVFHSTSDAGDVIGQPPNFWVPVSHSILGSGNNPGPQLSGYIDHVPASGHMGPTVEWGDTNGEMPWAMSIGTLEYGCVRLDGTAWCRVSQSNITLAEGSYPAGGDYNTSGVNTYLDWDSPTYMTGQTDLTASKADGWIETSAGGFFWIYATIIGVGGVSPE